MARPVALYRHYDRQGRLLYVGITDNMTRRSKEHSGNDWWKEVDDTRVQYLDTRPHAEALERVAIQFEKPLHNVALNPEARRKLIRPLPERPPVHQPDDDPELAALREVASKLTDDQVNGITLMAKFLHLVRGTPLEPLKDSVPHERFIEVAKIGRGRAA